MPGGKPPEGILGTKPEDAERGLPGGRGSRTQAPVTRRTPSRGAGLALALDKALRAPYT